MIMNMEMRIEEVTVVGDFTMTSYLRDFDAFKDFSDDYGPTFRANFTQILTDAKAVVSTRFHTSEIKATTNLLYADMVGLRPKMRRLYKYAKLAKNQLTVSLKDFGVQQVREQVRRMDSEKLSQALKELFENIDVPVNRAALLAKGFKAPEYTALSDLKTKIYDENQTQNGLMNERALAVQENNALFKELTDIIHDIHETGKALFLDTDVARTHEYTMTRLISRIRREREAQKVEEQKVMNGCVLYVDYEDEEGNAIADVVCTVVEYEQVAESDDEGVAYFENVPTEPKDKVTIKSVVADYLDDVQNEVQLMAGEDVEISVVLKKIG
jgi:hypothetical protein